MTSQEAEVAFDEYLSFTDCFKDGHFILVRKKEELNMTERDICDL